MTVDDAQQVARGGPREAGDAQQQCTGDDLLAGWREAGVELGMHLIVHSAMSSIGRVRGGAATVVDSLSRAIGSEGTLVVPAFTPQVADPHPEVRGVSDDDVRARRDQVPVFTLDLPSQMGAVAETLRVTPKALRSQHPQASVTALGARAQEIVARQPLHFAVGLGSPFETCSSSTAGYCWSGWDTTAIASCTTRSRASSGRGSSSAGSRCWSKGSGSGGRLTTWAMTTTPTSPSSAGTTNATQGSARWTSGTREPSCCRLGTSCPSPAAASPISWTRSGHVLRALADRWVIALWHGSEC